ncbi:putative hemolysin [Echinimonas agarilytica]|uniref:DUF333 domain-containing protein n=1 Tax=Echinimonas agarilytica TaxID=1215918 RepID=A0AA42B881_9GAMM|nr:DUF333 domain-containing protein [Echinimonas agarilytica]MCM2680108.1 DUF333 domain-containing protein [Echinimonas agarilytica]
MNKKLMLSVAIAVVAIVGCGQSTSESNASKTAVGMANPASEYCASLGGENVTEKSEDGDVAMCKLADGKPVDAWDLFRAHHPET